MDSAPYRCAMAEMRLTLLICSSGLVSVSKYTALAARPPLSRPLIAASSA